MSTDSLIQLQTVRNARHPSGKRDHFRLNQSSDTPSVTVEGPLRKEGCWSLLPKWGLRIRHHLTLVFMLLLTAVAMVIAVSHGLYFHYLDGTMTDQHHIQQSWVTAISLLMVTIFKACIIAAVGIAFAQHLWEILRREARPVRRIEELFLIRSNPFQLARFWLIADAQLLFFMALFVWLVPLAAIYPPAALTIASQPYTVLRDAEVGVLYPPGVVTFKVGDFSQRRLSNVEPRFFDENMFWEFNKPSEMLIAYARANLLTGDIAQTRGPNGENASFSLQFPGFRLSCNETAVNNIIERSAFLPNAGLIIYNLQWHDLGEGPSPHLTIRWTEDAGFYSNISDYQTLQALNPFSNWTDLVSYEGKVKTLTCRPKPARYEVDFTYRRSERQIRYTTHDSQEPMPVKNLTTPDGFAWLDSWVNKTTPPALTEELSAAMKQWERWAILSAAMSLLQYNCSAYQHLTTVGDARHTPAFKCGDDVIANHRPLDMSTFNDRRFREDDRHIGYRDLRSYNITEQSLNDYIANVTLSAFGLNIGKDKVPVNFTEYRTTYAFSSPKTLILPYALSFLFTLIFVVVGIKSLRQNGTPVVDGGFLQIMTTTVGRSTMENLVITYKDQTRNKVSSELLNLKIRYGELVDKHGVETGIIGFGTEEETKVLKRVE